MMYRPLRFFAVLGAAIFGLGTILGIRFLVYYFMGQGQGHIQSLILTAVLLMIGFQIGITGLLADIIAGNRKLIEDVQYRLRKMEYDEPEKKS